MSWKMTSGRCREEEDSSERDSVCMKAGRYEIMGKKTRRKTVNDSGLLQSKGWQTMTIRQKCPVIQFYMACVLKMVFTTL